MAKSISIVRKLDELGRVVIPKEIRERFDINEKDPIEIYVEGSSIILKKYEPCCIFCGNSKEVLEFNGKLICTKCIQKIKHRNEESDENE